MGEKFYSEIVRNKSNKGFGIFERIAGFKTQHHLADGFDLSGLATRCSGLQFPSLGGRYACLFRPLPSGN